MITPYLAAGLLFSLQAADPVDRFSAFMSRAQQLSVDLEVTAEGRPGKGVGRLEWRLPASQRFVMAWGPESYEFRQNAEGLFEISHNNRIYNQWGPVPFLFTPPGDLSGIGDAGYPAFLLRHIATRPAQATTWSRKGKVEVDGVEVDHVAAETTEQGVSYSFDYFIDSMGRLVRAQYRSSSPTEGGAHQVVTFKNYALSSPTDADYYGPNPPWGYSPIRITNARRTLPIGAQFTFGTWLDVRSGKTRDTAALAKGRYVAVAFTAHDCAVSARAEGALRKLGAALKEKGGELIEVSLGSEAPDTQSKDRARAVFHDKSGTVEAMFAPPGTPYIVLVGPEGTIVRAWYGYTSDSDAALVKNFMREFESGDGEDPSTP